MADMPVIITKDPVRERLKAVSSKLNGAGTPGKKLTAQEIEDALADIFNHLEISRL